MYSHDSLSKLPTQTQRAPLVHHEQRVKRATEGVVAQRVRGLVVRLRVLLGQPQRDKGEQAYASSLCRVVRLPRIGAS